MTTIEWTDAVWNPTTGCDQVSPGCDHCYALTMAGRLKAMGQARYQTDGDPRTSGPGFGLAMHPDVLDKPLRWRKPRRVFVNSMSDLFHPKVTDEFVARVFAAMAVTPRHTYQVLTKRPKRMRALLSSPDFPDRVRTAEIPTRGVQTRWNEEVYPLPNAWLGTSVEDQQRADERIPPLLDTPAAVRFLSCEPLLGPVDLTGYLGDGGTDDDPYGARCSRCGQADAYDESGHPVVGHDGYGDWCPGPMVASERVDWVIVGGESGPGSRPMHPQWARDLRDQCRTAGVPFFFKQWGAWAPPDQCGVKNHQISRGRFAYESDRFTPDGTRYVESGGPADPRSPGGYAQEGMETLLRVGKKAAGRELDGRMWDEFPAREVVPS